VPLSLVIHPIPGEGIANWVFRAAAENGYQNTAYVFTDAACGWRYSNRISRSSSTNIQVLANRIAGTNPNDVLSDMLHVGPDEALGNMAFYGTVIRASHFQFSNKRRVSTAHLRRANHLKDIWSVKPLVFDPDTLDILMSHCPICAQELGYVQTFGVHYCDKCSQLDAYGHRHGAVDLRDFVQPVIEPSDPEALNFITSLIDPDPAKRNSYRNLVPADLADIERGQLFDAAVDISKLIDSDTRAFRLTGTVIDMVEGIHPRSLEIVGRAILDWPAGVEVLVGTAQEFASRRAGYFGIAKEFGMLSNVLWSRNVPLVIRSRIRDCFRSDSFGQNAKSVRRVENRIQTGRATLTALTRKYGVSQKFVSKLARAGKLDAISSNGYRAAPLLIDEASFKQAVFQRRLKTGAVRIAGPLGIPKISAFRLEKWAVSSDCLDPSEPNLIPNCISLLEDIVRAAADSSSLFSPGIPLKDALVAIGYPTGDPWCSLFQAFTLKKVPIRLLEGRSPFAFRVHVRSLEDLREALEAFGQENKGEDDEVSNVVQAAIVLNTHYNNVFSLIKLGILQTGFRESDVYAVCRKVMFSPEVIWRLRQKAIRVVPKTLTGFLAKQRIEPLAVSPYGKKKIWRRGDIERLLGDAE
jgi:hypothetical protein